MGSNRPPTLANGKICYLEIPSTDPQRSAEFYQTIFGWSVRTRSDGELAFDDGVGEVSGSWVKNRKPATDPDILIYIWVENVADTIELIKAHGGRLVLEIGADAPEITARFADPDGNVLGLYQEPKEF
jgi:predicted enzyme related to lactoylglutathione lyase